MVTWKMINLGQVSRNQFWGEPDDVVRRPGICNGVVLFDTEQVVLVDPPYSNEEMLRCLDAHAGLKPKESMLYTLHMLIQTTSMGFTISLPHAGVPGWRNETFWGKCWMQGS